MFLSSVRLWNFRKFGADGDIDLDKPHLNLPLKEGLNVLVGENDSGKSAIIDAIRLTLGTYSTDWSRIGEDEFYKDSKRLRIELAFSDLSAEEAKNFIEWLSFEGAAPNLKTKLCVNYDLTRAGGRVLASDVKAGPDAEGHPLTAEAREYLKTTYLRPLRDASSELVPRKNSRLSQILHGHELFKGQDNDHELKKQHDAFNKAVEDYFEVVGKEGAAPAVGQALKKQVDAYLEAFYGEKKSSVINAAEGTLKAILEKLEISLRNEKNPGLGTLNRLFMASELVHLNKSKWHGLRLCMVEELEAHLHPQAQMQVIEALQNVKGIQFLLTTHSPNLASKVKLDSLVVCAQGHAFPMGKDAQNKSYSELAIDDHRFLEWFLDTTKANLFFARGVILVEGWAEELLVPALARSMKKAGLIQRDLTEAQVSIVNVGGTSHLRYAKIFARTAEPHLKVSVAVVTDVDVPCWIKEPKLGADGKPEKDDKGKTVYVYSKLPVADVAVDTAAMIAEKKADYAKQTTAAFVAPQWTMEYSLLSSAVFGPELRTAIKAAHPQIELADLEAELAQKLISRSLKKTEVAHLLAVAIDADAKSAAQKIVPSYADAPAAYLLEAIKHACRA